MGAWNNPVVLPAQMPVESPWQKTLRSIVQQGAVNFMNQVQSRKAAEATRTFQAGESAKDRASREAIAMIQAKRAGTTPQVMQLMDFRRQLHAANPSDERIPILDQAIQKASSYAQRQPIQTSMGYLTQDPNTGKWDFVQTEGAPGNGDGKVTPLPIPADVDLAAKKELETTKADVIGGGKITPKAKKADAQKRVSGVLNDLKAHYEELDKLGGIIDTEESTLSNIGARIGSSGLGQAVGRATGTKEQEIRDMINNSRPLLINFIRQASEMGARGLDSQKELEFYLQAATDPQRSIQANLNAIKVLEKAYGATSETVEGKVNEKGSGGFKIKSIKRKK